MTEAQTILEMNVKLVSVSINSKSKWYDLPIRILLKLYGYNGYTLDEKSDYVLHIEEVNQ